VTVVAVAQNNNGVESASFRYGADILQNRVVQGHPGCDFVVDPGGKMFGTSVLFDTGTTTAQYDLFEEDDNGNLVDLRFAIPQPFGPIGQFQVDGISISAVAAGMPTRTGGRAKSPTPVAAPMRNAKPAKDAKQKSMKKTMTKKAAKKKTAKKKAATKNSAKKRTTGRAATSAARKHRAPRKRTRRTSARGKHR